MPSATAFLHRRHKVRGGDRNLTPLLKPDFPPLELLAPLFSRVIEGGVFSNFGPLVSEFENKVAGELFDPCEHGIRCVSTSSGTAAIELAIQAMDLPRNSRIAIPAFGFVAVAAAVARLGYQPVFLDVNEQSWELAPEHADASFLYADIAAAIAVSPFGYPVDEAKWGEFSARRGIPILVDMAAGLGNQQRCGSIPFIFSLHATKAFGIGEGGLIATADQDLAHRLRAMTNFGFEDRVSREIGGNAKMSEWHGAIALAQLSRWRGIVARRQQVRAYYQKVFSGLAARFHPATWKTPVPAYMPIRMPTSNTSEALIKKLASTGIMARRWFYPTLPAHPAYRKFVPKGDLAATFPVACDLAATVVCLPFYAGLTFEKTAEIAGLVRNIMDEHGSPGRN